MGLLLLLLLRALLLTSPLVLTRSIENSGQPAEKLVDDMMQLNLDVAQEHFNREAANDIEGVLDLYAPEIIWEAPVRNLCFVGKDDVEVHYRAMFKAMQNLKFHHLERFAAGNRVVDHSIATFKLAGEGFLPLPLGENVELRLLHIFEFEDGKISKETAFEMWATPEHSG